MVIVLNHPDSNAVKSVGVCSLSAFLSCGGRGLLVVGSQILKALRAQLRIIPGVKQTVSNQEKNFFVLTLQNLYVLYTSTILGCIMKLCQIFVQM
jgi:hypothetical protein